MSGPADSLTIDELADRAGVSVRTVRYYITQGLLPGPGARGKAASYGQEHLARLRLIRRLADQHVPLVEQRARLEGLSRADVEALLREHDRYADSLQRAARTPSPKAYIEALLAGAGTRPATPPCPATSRLDEPPRPPLQPQGWQRWELAPGLELNVRADLAGRYSRLIQRLIDLAHPAPASLPVSDATLPSGGSADDL